MKKTLGYIAIALCAVSTMWVGTVNATLVGDTVTVGHYSPDNTTPQIGATPPSTFSVEAGNADIYTFYNSYPYGYRANVEAASILVDFNYLQAPNAGTWAADSQSCDAGRQPRDGVADRRQRAGAADPRCECRAGVDAG